MNKVNFSKDFYKKVYEAACEWCKKNYVNEDNEMYDEVCLSVYVDGYDIDLTAQVECEYRDESFDHAFGTWHDPYAGYEFSDVCGISDVVVIGEDGEVEGFSIVDYDMQFIDDSHDGISKGDRVCLRDSYNRPTDRFGEVLFYNNRTYEFCIQTDNGKKSLSRYEFLKVA